MEGFKTCDSLISEIEASHFFKDNPGLLDKASIYRWVYLALKQFGLNIMQKSSKMVEVENFRADLGSDFGKLSLAIFCKPLKCVVPKGCENRLLDTYFYKTRLTKYTIESSLKEDACGDTTCKEEETEIVEKLFLHEANCDLELHYTQPCYVKLGRDVLHDGCTDDCVNRNIIDSPYSVNIKGRTLYANFKEGSLYIEFYGLPQDENGVPIIPDTDRGKLELYLEAMVKRRILFDLQLTKDVQNIQFLYQDIYAEERQLFREAQQDLTKLNLSSLWKLIDENRKRVSRFDIHLK